MFLDQEYANVAEFGTESKKGCNKTNITDEGGYHCASRSVDSHRRKHIDISAVSTCGRCVYISKTEASSQQQQRKENKPQSKQLYSLPSSFCVYVFHEERRRFFFLKATITPRWHRLYIALHFGQWEENSGRRCAERERKTPSTALLLQRIQQQICRRPPHSTPWLFLKKKKKCVSPQKRR